MELYMIIGLLEQKDELKLLYIRHLMKFLLEFVCAYFWKIMCENNFLVFIVLV